MFYNHVDRLSCKKEVLLAGGWKGAKQLGVYTACILAQAFCQSNQPNHWTLPCALDSIANFSSMWPAMNFLTFVFSMLCIVSAIEERKTCNSEEVELLQQKTEMPNWSKVLSGIRKVTTQMNGAIVELNSKILDARQEFYASMNTFEEAHNATASVTQNLTEFKNLVKETMGNYVRFYKVAVKKVNATTTKTVLSDMGLQELTDRFDGMNKTAVEKLSTLIKTSEVLLNQVRRTNASNYGNTLVVLNDQLNKIVKTTTSFRETFNVNLLFFADVLEAPVKVALGGAAPEQITDMTKEAQTMLANLGESTRVLKEGLASAADDVDMNLKGHRKPFFKRVFGMFR